MANQRAWEDYSDSMKMFRDQCIIAGMSEEEFRKLYFESLEKHNEASPRGRLNKTKYKVLFIVTLVLACVIYNYNTIHSCIVCHMQDFIYPGLRILRKITIPFISLFPALSDLYHETCLLQNPFFTVTDMDCWPCSSVNTIREVQNPTLTTQQQNAPFIYETEQQVINFELLKNIYHTYSDVLKQDALKVLINNKDYIPLQEMFTQSTIEDKNLHIWKINNVHVAKLLRQYIPRPVVVPKFGQSTERFIIVDSSHKTFKVPDTECNYSFLLSLSGTRTIHLVPAEECKHQCRALKVELKETYLLWYNWWYWRPIVQPSTSNVTFIAHVGSYC